MKSAAWCLMMLCAGAAVAQGPSTAQTSSSPQLRPIGVITQLRPGQFTLHADAGPELLILLQDDVSVLQVPPGAKDLKSAAKIAVGDLAPGDRVLVRGRFSDDQKSLYATAVLVMSKADLATAHETERLEWQRRGIGGLVKAVDPSAKEITISVPNTPPTPGSPTHPVTISLAANAALLRYAPDSVKFSDAKTGAFDEIKTGDQVRALGAKSEDGSRFTAEKLVSGTFRNIGATVISVDAPNATLTVKELISGKPLAVRTNTDSNLRRLPPLVAQMIAMFVSGGSIPGAAQGAPTAFAGRGGAAGGSAGPANPGANGGPGRGPGAGPRDIQQMLDRMPPLNLSELKPGDALIVVSTRGAKPDEVTAITLLAGVEPILAAQPKGSQQMVLGPWNMAMGGGDAGP